MVPDQLWDDDLYEEPAEAYKPHKIWTGYTAVSKQTAAPPVSSVKLVSLAITSAQVVSRISLPQIHGVTHVDRKSDKQRFKELQHSVERAEEELRSRGEALAVLTTRAQKSQQLAAQIQVHPMCHSMHAVSDVKALHTSTHCCLVCQLATCRKVYTVQAEVIQSQQEQLKLSMEQPIPLARLQMVETSMSGRSAALHNQLELLTETQQVLQKACTCNKHPCSTSQSDSAVPLATVASICLSAHMQPTAC